MQGTLIMTNTTQELVKGTRRIIHQGGAGSGKTVNILGSLAEVACSDGPGVTTVTSMSMPHLKGGALRDFEMYVYPTFKPAIKKYHRTDHIFTFTGGHEIEFKVFENEMTARGPRRKRLYVNEANKMAQPIWMQLDMRSEQSIIDYNPSIRFWAHDDLIDQPGNITFYSDHRSNPFLSAEKHKQIENLYNFETKKGSHELWKVYARGLTGNVTGLIFPNWQMIDDRDFPKDEDFIFGIDYGYTNDPTAIMKICLIGNTLFVKEIAYETGLPPQSIRQILLANGYDGEISPLYSEHDPDMIKALRKLDLNVFPARKGAGSIKAGIELLNTFDVRYTNSSRNLHRERGLYVWEEQKDTGKLTNIPVDNNNHTFDATRYAVYTRYLRN